jgi:hypothetical protein
MRRITHWATGTAVRFCDSCGEVTTADQRARRHLDRVHARAPSLIRPR